MNIIKKILILSSILILTIIGSSATVSALTDGDWEYVIQDSKITITDYIGENPNAIVPASIKNCPVVAISIDNTRNFNQKLESVQLPETICEIGENSFYNCRKLKYINFPKALKNIGKNAFYSCHSLSSIDLSYVETIGEYAFWECQSLEYVTLSPSLKTIPDGLLTGTNIKSIDIPNSVESIGEAAFARCSIEHIIIPGNVKSVGATAFGNCENLKSVIISYGVEKLKPNQTTALKINGTFVNCTNLQELYIPSTVIQIPKWFTYDLKNVIIYCAENSYTSEFCQKEGLSYLIDNSVDSQINVLYNGSRISFHSYGQNPQILGGRTLVPLRSIFEAMGAEVQWDSSTNTAIAKRNNVEVKIQIGANEIFKNGKNISVDVPAQLINNRTMVPVRVVAESFGADVQWNGNSKTVMITE